MILQVLFRILRIAGRAYHDCDGATAVHKAGRYGSRTHFTAERQSFDTNRFWFALSSKQITHLQTRIDGKQGAP
jgi:hypothetical protein